jgi:CIC family chloride channel protein
MACVASYLVTALLMPRSILTEKISRRGYHLSREYGVDPLELVIVRELMSEEDVWDQLRLPEAYVFSDATARAAAERMAADGLQTLAVVDRKNQKVCGTISINDLLRGRNRSVERESELLRLFGYVPPQERRT